MQVNVHCDFRYLVHVWPVFDSNLDSQEDVNKYGVTSAEWLATKSNIDAKLRPECGKLNSGLYVSSHLSLVCECDVMT